MSAAFAIDRDKLSDLESTFRTYWEPADDLLSGLV
jgi:hypothetical protein